MNHIRQSTSYSCGACAAAMIANISEQEAMNLCKTKKSGTHSTDVLAAFKKIGIEANQVFLSEEFEKIWWIAPLSTHFPLYISGNFICNSGRGRNSHRHHAFVVADKKIYDPAEEFVLDFDCINHLFNKKLIINSIIVVHKEISGYGSNVVD